MDPESLSHRVERRLLSIPDQHLRPRHSARLGSRARNLPQLSNRLIGHRQLDRMPPSCREASPRLIDRKRGIRQPITSSMIAAFMESIV